MFSFSSVEIAASAADTRNGLYVDNFTWFPRLRRRTTTHDRTKINRSSSADCWLGRSAESSTITQQSLTPKGMRSGHTLCKDHLLRECALFLVSTIGAIGHDSDEILRLKFGKASAHLFQGVKGVGEVAKPVSAETYLLESGKRFKLGRDRPQAIVLSTKNPEVRWDFRNAASGNTR